MAILLDTGYYFALINKKDPHHKNAISILEQLSQKKFGRIYTTNFILDESLTLLNVRTKGNRMDLLKKMKNLFLGGKSIAKLFNIELEWSYSIFELQNKMTSPGNPVSFTDASNIIFCKKHSITNIVSFDHHYFGFLSVIN